MLKWLKSLFGFDVPDTPVIAEKAPAKKAPAKKAPATKKPASVAPKKRGRPKKTQ